MVNKDTVLQLTDNGLNVFRHYIQGQWRVGRNFLNPLYEDKRASCNVYYDRRTNTYRMKDFGNDEFSGDCFSLVAKLKGLNCKNPKDFVEVLQTINRDLNLGLDEEDTSFVVSVSPVIPKEAVIESKKNKPYSTVQKQFSPKEIAFWQQYGITAEILKAYKTVSLKEFRSENSEGKPVLFYVIGTRTDIRLFGKTACKNLPSVFGNTISVWWQLRRKLLLRLGTTARQRRYVVHHRWREGCAFVGFIYCQFSHFPIIFHFRHVGVREMHGVADLAIGTVQWCNANLLTEISLRRTVSPPVKTSGSYITAKQFKNRCAFPALKIFSASLHVTILLIYYSTILLLY